MSCAACNSVMWKRDGDVQHAILRCGSEMRRAACNSTMWKRGGDVQHEILGFKSVMEMCAMELSAMIV